MRTVKLLLSAMLCLALLMVPVMNIFAQEVPPEGAEPEAEGAAASAPSRGGFFCAALSPQPRTRSGRSGMPKASAPRTIR